MTLARRFSFFFTFLFSALLATAMITVYLSFNQFRKKEFQVRLLEKGESTINLLLKVEGVDADLLKIVDQHTVNRLYRRKVLVLDGDLNIIYNTTSLRQPRWTKKELLSLKMKQVAFKKIKQYETSGSYYNINNEDYYVLVSAEDQYGEAQLRYLRYVLVISFLTGSILVWVLSFYLSKRGLRPLDKVRNEIQEITDKNLNRRLPEPENDDELRALSRSFNQMMDRIDSAYQRQAEFKGNASHELRTPLTRILLQLENILQQDDIPSQAREVLESIKADSVQLSEIVTSLLLLSEINNKKDVSFEKVRLDEIIFNSVASVTKNSKDLRFQFEIDNSTSNTDLEIEADETLLQIAFINLIRNAYLYSDEQSVRCVIYQLNDVLVVRLTNSGPNPEVADTSLLFNAFSRGSNSNERPGIGLGLRIVKRILEHHRASIEFEMPEVNLNEIVVSIPIRSV